MPNRSRLDILAVLAFFLLIQAASPGCRARQAEQTLSPQEIDLNVESFDVVWETVHKRHFDPEFGGLDWPALRKSLRPKVAKAGSMDEVRSILSEMLNRLGQSHFAIIPSGVMEDLALPPGESGLNGHPGLETRVIGSRALVTSVWQGFPAEKAGVRPGWEVRKVGDKEIAPLIENLEKEFAGKSTLDIVLASAVSSRWIGKVGDTVAIAFIDGEGQQVVLDITLAEERGEKFNYGIMNGMYVWSESKMLRDDVGYFYFSRFMHPVAVMPALAESMDDFMDARGIVLDIRGNTGGMLPMGMGMAGWFIDKENLYLGTMYLRDNTLKAIIMPRPNTYDGPVAILVDGVSASMSEIFAGGLKDLGRARIFGSRTAGAALPSQIQRLPNGDGFQFAVANYISTGGEVLEGVGVIPDVVIVPSREDLLQGRDPVLETAVSWILSESE